VVGQLPAKIRQMIVEAPKSAAATTSSPISVQTPAITKKTKPSTSGATASQRKFRIAVSFLLKTLTLALRRTLERTHSGGYVFAAVPPLGSADKTGEVS
jgi:hypothetical protein